MSEYFLLLAEIYSTFLPFNAFSTIRNNFKAEDEKFDDFLMA